MTIPFDPRADAQIKQLRRAFQAKQVPRTLSASGSALITDYLLGCDATSAGFTVTLPTVLDARGMVLLIVKTDATANVLTIAAAGSDAVNGAATQTVSTQWGGFQLYCDGVSWYNVQSGPGYYAAGDWTPAPTNLTVVGAPTYSGKYTKAGRLVVCTMSIAAATSTASTANSTFFTGLPFTQSGVGATCSAANHSTVASYGVGVVAGSSVFTPTWPAVANVDVSFSYFT